MPWMLESYLPAYRLLKPFWCLLQDWCTAHPLLVILVLTLIQLYTDLLQKLKSRVPELLEADVGVTEDLHINTYKKEGKIKIHIYMHVCVYIRDGGT